MGFKWFELVDEAGKAMTRMNYVSVDVPFAAGLRKAVQAEYATTFLAAIAPSELVVYANRAAFDAKRVPSEFDPIDSFGESPTDPLIVEAPPSNIPTMKRKWFQLVDVAGEALADVDAVSIDPPMVLMLRKAVKAEYADSRHLAGIAPIDLVVYANRAALNDNQPLKGSDPIDSLGESDEDPLIVQAALPETASARAASGFQNVQELVEASVRKVLEERDEKRSVYSISDLNSELGRRIKRKMHLIDEHIEVDEPVDTSIAGYEWIPEVAESHESQREGYMSYLQLHLKPLLDRGDFQLDDIAHDKTVLSVVDPRLPFRMNGTADVLLVNRRTNVIPDKLAGIRFVIELKKQVESSDFAQALGQLVSCSLKAPRHCYPVSLLTDLNGRWHFSWFNEESVVTHVTLVSPKNAVDFIIAAAIGREGSVPFQVPFIPRPLKRLRVDDFLPMPSDGADEMMERYELMADELDPDFLTERRIEYMQHLVQTMPAYAHMYT